MPVRVARALAEERAAAERPLVVDGACARARQKRAALLGVRRPWAARALQVVLVLGAAEWIRTLLTLVAERQAEGRPFVRMGVILGTIAFLSLLSAAAFATRGIKTRFGIGTTPPFRLS